MIITEQDLLEVIPPQRLAKSKYRQIQDKIRLFNSNPKEATVPALYPNTKQYRNLFIGIDNVTKKQVDTINGKRTNNRKIDLILDYQRDIDDVPTKIKGRR